MPLKIRPFNDTDKFTKDVLGIVCSSVKESHLDEVFLTQTIGAIIKKSLYVQFSYFLF